MQLARNTETLQYAKAAESQCVAMVSQRETG